MTERDSQSSMEDNVKRVLSWASVAYAFGFVTVMAHTSRLGLPVIELLHPIYIWVGLPLAAVAFFFKHIADAFQKRSSELAAEIRAGWSRTTSPQPNDDLDLLAELIGIIRAIPGIGSKQFAALIEDLKELALPKFQQVIEQATAADAAKSEKNRRRLRKILGISRIALACLGAIELFGYAVLLILSLYLYVWELYPRIPLSLGGGMPKSVNLIVEANALPASLVPERILPATSAPLSEKATINLPVTLLYLTKDAYYVETNIGTRISIKADSVKSTIWEPKGAK